MRIPLSKPDISEQDIASVLDVLRSGQLSLGPQLDAFEEAFAQYLGVEHAVAVSSGTAGLHLCMLALNIQPGDEIITTPFSFIASANCALMVGAVPVFADIHPDTWNIDPAAIRRVITDRTRAILPVHVFGQPARMDVLQDLAFGEGLSLIEDVCEALGARYQNKLTGTFGDLGVFGFYPNKQLTTGEGGMVVTRQESLANQLRSLRNQGRDFVSGWLAHPRMGYNYRLDEMSCALGLSQFRRLEDILARRAQVASWYIDRLRREPRLVLQQIRSDATMSWFVMVVRLADHYERADRDRILRELRDKGIGCGNYFAPIHLQPFYIEQFGYARGQFPHCERIADRTIALPFHPGLTESCVDEVCETLTSLL